MLVKSARAIPLSPRLPTTIRSTLKFGFRVWRFKVKELVRTDGV
jgi:hypothetical protein